MKLIDIHAHLDFKDYDADRAEVIRRAREAECGVINVGVDLETSKAVIKLAEENELMWATVGLHPTDADEQGSTLLTDELWQELEKLAGHEKVVAIGECGLDYFKRGGGSLEVGMKEKQKEIFEKQIGIALKVDKPLMIHCRDARPTEQSFGRAYDELLGVLKLHASSSKLRANIHFFAGNLEQAKQFLDLGFTLSFTGVITFTHDYDEVVKFAPLDKILAETDSPFVAPVPYRGKRNEPLYVAEVVKKIAEIKGLPLEEVQAAVLRNAIAFIG